MKSIHLMNILTQCLSHPARGAWIEIKAMLEPESRERRRTPQGVRGLK